MNDGVDLPRSSDPAALDLRQRFGFDLGSRRDEQALQHAGRILEHLRTQLAELDRREQNLNSQLSSMDQERRSLRLWSQQFTEEAERREQEMRAREIQLAERESGFEAFAAQVESREKSLSAEWESIAAARAALKSELAHEIETERQELTENQRRLEIDSREFERQRAAFETEQALALENQRRELESLRTERLGQLEQREAEVARREIDVDKRARFHEDHLDRVRRDLAEQRRDLERERQRQKVWMEQVEESIRLRLAHVRRYRDLVAQREQSLETEHNLLAQAQSSFEREQATSQIQFDEQWTQLRHDQSELQAAFAERDADLHRRQESLDARAESLDRLRTEIDRANQLLLEQTVAIDEARAAIEKTIGQPETEAILQATREKLLDQWRHIRESLVQQRDEVELSRQSLNKLRDEFRSEREQVTHWINQREAQLRTMEEALTSERNTAREVEARWTATRDRWRQEKMDAENVIRGLLLQLEMVAGQPSDVVVPIAPPQPLAA